MTAFAKCHVDALSINGGDTIRISIAVPADDVKRDTTVRIRKEPEGQFNSILKDMQHHGQLLAIITRPCQEIGDGRLAPRVAQDLP